MSTYGQTTTSTSPAKTTKSPSKALSSNSSAANKTNGSTNGVGANNGGTTPSYIWQWDLDTVERWLRSLPLPKVEGDKTISEEMNNQYITIFIQSISPLLSGCPEDTYNIVPSNVARGESIQHTAGSIVSRLPLYNIVNALSPKEGGNEESLNNVSKQVKSFASSMLRAITAQVEIDMMESTPSRIIEILCPEVTQPEINAIRKRIYDTVILGRGTNSSATAQSLEEDEVTTTSSKATTSILEQFQKCKTCGNNDQSNFALDKKNGDVICMECGTVTASSLMHEGSQFRKFEGEVDRNHHGDCPNPLFSNAHNMSTTLGGINASPSDRMGGGGSKKTIETVLRNAHAYTEMNISQFNSNEKKTRIGYKDKQKKEAFSKMHHVGDALSLHEAVIQRAKELFSGFRDDRELVQQFKGVVAACICEAYHQLSLDGKRILKQRIVEENTDESKVLLAKRAHWRNYLHKTTAASQEEHGNEHIVSKDNTSFKAIASAVDSNSTTTVTAPAYESVPISSWELSDCRSFLLESSRKIAHIWSSSNDTKPPYPDKSQDELEGMLIEYTLTMCDHLEQQLNNTASKNDATIKRNTRVITPKAESMGNLSITWQNSDPVRSGMTINSHKNKQINSIKKGKTPGQILLLLSAKKWSAIMKDNVAGEAFHREFKTVLALQESQRSKKRQMEMAEQRFRRIKRKPWLQARAKI